MIGSRKCKLTVIIFSKRYGVWLELYTRSFAQNTYGRVDSESALVISGKLTGPMLLTHFRLYCSIIQSPGVVGFIKSWPSIQLLRYKVPSGQRICCSASERMRLFVKP